MRRAFKKIIRFGYNSPEKTNRNLNYIRDTEWNSIKRNIKPSASFLDVGCGTGYSMKRAIEELGCTTVGIDPQPMVAGVKIDVVESHKFKIIKGVGENLPFQNETFDVVFSSHVLEHVENPVKVLQEVNRVLKKDGTLIMGVPTATLAWIGLSSHLLFTSHIRIARYIAGMFTSVRKTKFKHIFIPYSHSNENQTVLSDIRNYKIIRWRILIEKEFQINEEVLPLLYGFAEFKSPFNMKKYSKISSSVFFICKRK